MREILEGIYTWSKLSEPNGYDFSGFFVPHSEGNLCIDPVEPGAATLERIRERGIGHIVLTNRNHVRASNLVREHTGARTAIHPADAPVARENGAELDDELRAGEIIGPFVVVSVPGKSPGEVALLWPEREILLVGDAIIGNPPGQCSVLPEDKLDDPPLLYDSLRRLLTLSFDVILAADGVSIVDGAKDRLRALVAGLPD